MESRSGSCGRKRKRDDQEIDVLAEAPREIHIVNFAESRAAEIEALTRACETVGGAKRVFQTLPRHMRRRAMSHNIKRLPRRLHDQAAREYEAQAQKAPSKRPSRRFRRRPKNLMAEYARRQRKHVWLETHIWHAKRFKMADRWGYRVAIQPNEKSSRAAYRAVSKHCLMQDVSYLCCVELVGPQDVILAGLGQVTSPHTGKTFAAKMSLNGSREGETLMYSFQKYPYDAIGCVSFLWNPGSGSPHGGAGDSSSATESRQLWIWCHPVCYKQVLEELCKCFSMEMPNEHVEEKKVEENKTSNFPGEHETATLKKKLSVSAGGVTLTSLKDTLVRFRLWGPLSQAVLSDLFQKPVVTSGTQNADLWWRSYFSDQPREATNESQWEMWNALKTAQSPAELSPHTVVGLTVRDPRLFLPPKKTKVMNSQIRESKQTKEGGRCDVLPPSPDLATSPLWSDEIRKQAGVKRTEQEINDQRSQLLIPGSLLDLGEQESRVPLLLIQRPGKQVTWTTDNVQAPENVETGFGCGWDLILPAGWGMAFWVSLVYRGARVGGTREWQCVQRELGQLYFPNDYPDTRAGIVQADLEKTDLVAKHGRYPPAKRPNFVKLGTVAPFHCPWQKLVSEWKESFKSEMKNVDENPQTSATKADVDSPFFVLRDKTRKELSRQLGCLSQSEVKSDTKLCFSRERLLGMSNSLVAVNVSMLKRGTPDKFSSICLPTGEDLKNLEENMDYGGPVEPLHKDIGKEVPKKRKKRKKNSKSPNVDNSVPDTYGLDRSLLTSCSRKIIGFVNSGGFSLSTGFGKGLGFCSTLGLLNVEAPRIALVRSPNSLQYRFVKLKIIL